MLVIFQGIGCDLCADIRHAGCVNGAFYQICLCDKICIGTRNVLARCDAGICLLQGLCDDNVIIGYTGVLERVNGILDLDVRDDRRSDAIHQNHLRDHTAAHLACAYDTGANNLAFLLTLEQFTIHVQHIVFPPFCIFYVPRARALWFRGCCSPVRRSGRGNMGNR